MIPSAYLILNTRRKKKNGKYPVKIRVVSQRVPYELKTGIDLTEVEFEEILSGRAPKALKEAKIKLDGFKAKVDRILKDMDIFTFQKLYKFRHWFFGSRREDFSGRSSDKIFPQ